MDIADYNEIMERIDGISDGLNCLRDRINHLYDEEEEHDNKKV